MVTRPPSPPTGALPRFRKAMFAPEWRSTTTPGWLAGQANTPTLDWSLAEDYVRASFDERGDGVTSSVRWTVRAVATLWRRLRHRDDDYNRANAEQARSFCRVRGRRVLVVGCNTGGDCRYFVGFGAVSVVGIDVIEAIGTEYRDARVTYARGSAESMPFDNGSFDLVYSVATMEHIPNIRRAFSEMARVTAKGGTVYCFAAPLWNSRFGHHEPVLFADAPWIHLRMSEDEIVRYARKRGSTTTGSIEERVTYMLDDRFFNKVPASHYVEVCSELQGMNAIHNELHREKPDLLPAELAAELTAKGFTSEELLAVCHTYVGLKV